MPFYKTIQVDALTNASMIGERTNVPPQGPTLQIQQLPLMAPVKIDQIQLMVKVQVLVSIPITTATHMIPSQRGTLSPNCVSVPRSCRRDYGRHIHLQHGRTRWCWWWTGNQENAVTQIQQVRKYSFIRSQSMTNSMMRTQAPGRGGMMTVNSDFELTEELM